MWSVALLLMGRVAGVLALALALGLPWIAPHPSRADEVLVADFHDAEDIPPSPWQLEVHEGEPEMLFVQEETGRALCLRSDASSSYALERRVEVDVDRTPYLVWDWKVTALPERGHFLDPSRDDQAAQLIVAFDTHVLGQRRVISYIWGGTASEGTTGQTATGENVPFLDMKAVVVESGHEETGRWRTVARNVAKDYRRLFQEEPSDPVGIRIQINSQHTDARAESFWRSIRFTDKPPGEPAVDR